MIEKKPHIYSSTKIANFTLSSIEIINNFKYRRSNILISDCKIEQFMSFYRLSR